MRTTLRLAWRNLWRNPRRTILSLLALALGVTAIVSVHSLQIAANDELVRGITRGLVGDVQIHGAGYQDAPDVATVVAAPARVAAAITAAIPGARCEPRVLGVGLARSADDATAAAVFGIAADNPDAEATLRIASGRGLRGALAGSAVIGTGLAAALGLAPGGELVLVGRTAGGKVANQRFTVVGTADTGSSEADAAAVFMAIGDAQAMYGLGDAAHALIVRLPDSIAPAAAAHQITAALASPALEVLPWTAILPELHASMAAKARNSRIIDAVVFLIVALGVLNTMTMATFERTRELGVLAALGTRPRRLLAMIVTESLLLAVIGFAIGVAIAAAVLLGIGQAHLSALGAVDIMGVRMPEAIRLTVRAAPVASAAVVAVLTMLAGGLLPAVRAARLVPVDAMRHV